MQKAMITEQEVKKYRSYFENRWNQEEKELNLRYEKAVKLTQKISDLLKNQFLAKEVFTFGSINRKEKFHLKSDIDIAVIGLDESVYYKAYSQLISLDPSIEINLIRKEDSPAWLSDIIEKDGVSI